MGNKYKVNALTGFGGSWAFLGHLGVVLGYLLGLLGSPVYRARFGPSPPRVFVQGLCIVARAAAPLCVGFPRRGCWARGRLVRGCGGFLSGLGVPRGVGPPFFRVWRRCGC